MEITTLCAVVAALSVIPNRSQFFQYESVSLSCGHQRNSPDWRIKKNTSAHTNQECVHTRNKRNESGCHIDSLYPVDSGVYWCESAAGECRDAVNITVTGHGVILESPVLPVTEGDNVTLRCLNMMTSSSTLMTDFFKDGRLIRSSSTGNMTIHSLSKSDEGVYKCNISGVGQSPDSWLTVRAGRPGTFNYTILHILLPVVVASLLLVSVMLVYLWRSDKGGPSSSANSTVVYTAGVRCEG